MFFAFFKIMMGGEDMSNMVPIAVIDSGISLEVMNDMKCNIQRYKIMDNGDGLALVPGGDDANGHGSMCISTIYKECPQVEILSIRIFDSELDTSIRYLEYALECLLYRDVKVINLSLALTQKVDTADLLKICRELEKQGKIIIAAVENGEKSSQPSNYKGVIGVQGELIRDNIWELRLGNLDFIKQSIPFLHTDQHNYYKMFCECNSSAAAMVTGIVAKMLLERPELKKKDIIRELKVMSIKKFNFEKKFSSNRLHPVFRDESIQYDKEKLKQIDNILMEFFDKQDGSLFYTYALFSSRIGGREMDYFGLIKKLETEFRFKVADYRTISKYDCVSIYSLYKLLMEELAW